MIRRNSSIVLGAVAAFLLTASSASADVMMATWTGTLTYNNNGTGNSQVGYDTTDAFGLASLEGAAFTVTYTYNTAFGNRVIVPGESDTLTSISGFPPPVTAILTINGQSLAIGGSFDSTAGVVASTGMANFGTRDSFAAGSISTYYDIFNEGTIPGLLPSLDDTLPTTAVTGYNADQYLQIEVDDDSSYPNPTIIDQHVFAYLQPTTLTISEVPATEVPEPSAWAMLLPGLFGAGFILRGARRKDAVAVA